MSHVYLKCVVTRDGIFHRFINTIFGTCETFFSRVRGEVLLDNLLISTLASYLGQKNNPWRKNSYESNPNEGESKFY